MNRAVSTLASKRVGAVAPSSSLKAVVFAGATCVSAPAQPAHAPPSLRFFRSRVYVHRARTDSRCSPVAPHRSTCSPAQVRELSALAEKAGFHVLEAWSAHATHLVAVGAAARKGSKQATKGAMTIAANAGMPVVTAEWLRACAETGFDLDEAPYSVV